MAILTDPIAQALEDKREEQERAYVTAETAKRREHEYRLSRLEYSVNTRHKMWMSIAKAPAWIILAITIPRLIKANRAVPQFLQDFMSL